MASEQVVSAGPSVTGPKIVFDFEVLGLKINITETIVIGWFIIVVLTLVILFLTHNMSKLKPKKKQVVAELLVSTFKNIVKESMGEKNLHYTPYMMTIFMFSIFGSLISLIGLRSVTADFNTTVTWALMTFFTIQFCKIKTNGFLGYIKGFGEPFIVMTPLNIISEIATPVSMSFRHFGNIAGGMIITQLLYFALGSVSKVIGISVPIFTVGIPAILSVYFDLFSGFMQAYIFIMLSMTFISTAKE